MSRIAVMCILYLNRFEERDKIKKQGDRRYVLLQYRMGGHVILMRFLGKEMKGRKRKRSENETKRERKRKV